MSLLMQALKKAERAKQNSAESELDKPSEAFDQFLTLTPQEAMAAPAAAPTPPAAPAGLSLQLEDDPGFSLAPMPEPAAPAAQPAAPSAAIVVEGLPPIPVLTVATEAIHDPTPPQARYAEPAAATPPAAPEPTASRARSKAEAKAEAEAPRGAARAKAAAAAQAPSKEGLDPAKLRLIVLSAIALLILAVFGYLYWQATSGPGSGSKLPMVPMPPPNATGATPATVVVPAEAPVETVDAKAIAEREAREAHERDEQQQRELRERQSNQNARNQARAPDPALLAAQSTAGALAAPEALPPVVAGDSGDIKVVRNNNGSAINPALQDGYRAFNAGDLSGAQQHYQAALQDDPNNRDALLGIAALAVKNGQNDQAAATYARLLELDPGDAEAMAGLIGLHHGDSDQSEMRLKDILLHHADSGPVLFALGNLYARQGRWPEAQQAFFRAYTAIPDNPDYAFNLAVGLDRLNQPKLALGYYQRALALAQDHPGSFDKSALRKRLQELNHGATPPAAAAAAGS